MNTSQYDIRDSVTVGNSGLNALDAFARKYVAGYYMYAFALIVVLVLLVIYLYMSRSSESFLGAIARNQSRDDYMDSTNTTTSSTTPAASTTPTYYQSGMVDSGITIPTFTPDPNAAPGAPGSLSYLVLNDPTMACATTPPVGTDAWSWMVANIGGPSTGAVAIPTASTTTESFSDNDLSAISQGYHRQKASTRGGR